MTPSERRFAPTTVRQARNGVRYGLEQVSAFIGIRISAMKAEMDRQTARKYIEAGKCPTELQAKHTWRSRPDPLEKIWPEVTRMLEDAPELEAKTLFEHFLARPDSGLEESYLRTFFRRVLGAGTFDESVRG